MSKNYIVDCYTCQHNGQETCKGCNTLLVGEDEPYENWQLREDLETKDQRIAELEERLKNLKEKYVSMINENVIAFDKLEKELANAIVPKFKVGDKVYAIIDTFAYTDVLPVEIRDTHLLYEVWDGQDTTKQHFTRIFATKEEAQAKLKELQGENK